MTKNYENLTIKEARKLHIPVIAMTDSNCDPELIDYIIPSNDDAISSIVYFTQKAAEACLVGLEKRSTQVQQQAIEAGKKQGKSKHHRRTTKGSEVTKTYVARGAREDKFEGNAAEGFSAKVEEKKPEEKQTTQQGSASADPTSPKATSVQGATARQGEKK